jgi:hypothetical protein
VFLATGAVWHKEKNCNCRAIYGMRQNIEYKKMLSKCKLKRSKNDGKLFDVILS